MSAAVGSGTARGFVSVRMDFKLAFYGPARKIARSIMEQDITESAYFFKLWAWFDKNKKQVAWVAAPARPTRWPTGCWAWGR